MIKESEELLLKDLCARLPYGVICNDNRHGSGRVTYIDITPDNIEQKNGKVVVYYFDFDECGELKNCKPYLRPISSITKEEMEELKTLCSIYIPTDSPNIGFEEYGIVVFTHHLTNNTYSFKLNISVIDWFNKKMFDYRGLIEKGLAIEVNENNNPYKCN